MIFKIHSNPLTFYSSVIFLCSYLMQSSSLEPTWMTTFICCYLPLWSCLMPQMSLWWLASKCWWLCSLSLLFYLWYPSSASLQWNTTFSPFLVFSMLDHCGESFLFGHHSSVTGFLGLLVGFGWFFLFVYLVWFCCCFFGVFKISWFSPASILVTCELSCVKRVLVAWFYYYY